VNAVRCILTYHSNETLEHRFVISLSVCLSIRPSRSGILQKWFNTRRINELDQWCLRMLLGMKWYQFVRNDDVWRQTKQPRLTAIIQSRRLTLFGHIMCMDDNADVKRILLVLPPVDWKRHPGRPHITWLSTVQLDLKQHHLMLPKAADLAQNRPLWRMMSTYGATQS